MGNSSKHRHRLGSWSCFWIAFLVGSLITFGSVRNAKTANTHGATLRSLSIETRKTIDQIKLARSASWARSRDPESRVRSGSDQSRPPIIERKGDRPFVESRSLSRLAVAVAMAETSDCSRGVGITHNNCHGIRKWNGKKLLFARYESKKKSYDDFKDIWKRLYNGRTIPTKEDAKRYSGGDRSESWHKNVLYFLKKPQ